MTLPPETRLELDDLISRHLDLVLTTDEAGRLDVLLMHDPEARRVYYDCVALHAGLAWDAAPAIAIPRVHAPMPVVRRPWFLALGAAAIVAVALLVPGLLRPSRTVVRASSQDEVPAFIATVIDDQGCTWASGALPTAVGSRLTTGTLRLLQGEAVIGFANGAQVALSGPTTIALESGRSATLVEGLVAVDTPVRAHGFTINARAIHYVDLGTRFTLDVRSTGDSTLAVLIGTVSVQTGERSSPHLRTVAAGQRIGCDAVGQERDPAPRDLTREDGLVAILTARMATHAPPDHATSEPPAVPAVERAEYPTQVLADHPIGYWRFNDTLPPGMTTILDSSPTHQNGRLHGGVRSISGVPGIGGRALSFDGATGFVSIPNRAEYAVDDLSVELWVQSTEPWTHPWWPGDAVLITKDVPGSGNQDWSIIAGSYALPGHPSDNGRVIVGIGVNHTDVLICSQTALNDGRWHHLVWTRTAAGLGGLYVDGVLSMSNARTPGSITNALDIEIGGGTRSAEGSARATVPLDQVGRPLGNRLFLAGALEEIALYAQALTAQRVSTHFQAATRAGSQP
jgi:hypothetical protein